MQIVGVFSIKGGVGKTATAVNLSYLSARGRRYTLLWDLDPQAASTFYFRLAPKVRGAISRLLDPERGIDERIQETDIPYLDILPADEKYRTLDLVLQELDRPKTGIGRVLKPLTADYDYIFLDCPPSMSLLSENIFRAVDVLLVPVIPTTLSQRTLIQLEEFCAKNRIKTPVLPFFSMVDKRKRLHRDVIDELRESRDDMLRTEIPYVSEIEKMGINQSPLAVYSERGNAGYDAFTRLWREIRKRLAAMSEPAAQTPERVA